MKDEDEAPESDRCEPAPHPRHVARIFGQQRAESEILNAFRGQRLPQAWILGGPQGIGKATLAWRAVRFLAAHPDPTAPEVLSAQNLDVDPKHPAARKISALSYGDLALLRRQWDAKTKKFATRISVEDIRAILPIFTQSAGEGGWRMAIVDSADDLNASSANALLKLIEEPPPRSVFFFIAHQPGRLLPTIRSRCRFLALPALAPPEVDQALRAALADADEKIPDAEILRASAGAIGSVREALRLIEPAAAELDRLIDAALAQLPDCDQRLPQTIGGKIASRENLAGWEAFVAKILDWLSEAVAVHKAQGPRACAPFAQAWENFSHDVREVEIYNLDKRAFVILSFNRLAEAFRAARAS